MFAFASACLVSHCDKAISVKDASQRFSKHGCGLLKIAQLCFQGISLVRLVHSTYSTCPSVRSRKTSCGHSKIQVNCIFVVISWINVCGSIKCRGNAFLVFRLNATGLELSGSVQNCLTSSISAEVMDS